MQDFTGTFQIHSRRAFNWWASELLDLFPISVLGAFSQGPDNTLTLYDDDGRLRVVPRDRPSDGLFHSVADEAASWPVFSKEDADIASGAAVVWLPHSTCLERHFTVPAAAARDLERIARLELERATPFKSTDVCVSYLASPSPDNHGALSVRQFIVKRDTIAGMQSRLQQMGVNARTITCLDKTGQKQLPINFLAASETAGTRKSEVLPVLAAVAVLLVATAAAIAVLRSERALSDVAARTSQARAEWQERQNAAKPALAKREEANAVAAIKAKYVPTVLILNELTRVLPDDVHLLDLKIAERTVVISGLGRDTSRLIPLLEGSGMFADVQLAAPVTVDPATDSERFSIRSALRSEGPRPRERIAEEPL